MIAAAVSGVDAAGGGQQHHHHRPPTTSPHRVQELRIPLPREKVLQLDQEPHLKALRRRLQIEAAGILPEAAEAAATSPVAASAAAARKAKREAFKASLATELQGECTSLDGPVCPWPATAGFVGRRNPYDTAAGDGETSGDETDRDDDVFVGAEDDPEAYARHDARKVQREIGHQIRKMEKMIKANKAREGKMREMKASAARASETEDAGVLDAEESAADEWRPIGGKKGAAAAASKKKASKPAPLREQHPSKEGGSASTKKKRTASGEEGAVEETESRPATKPDLDGAILKAALDIRCDVCRAVTREVFAESSAVRRITGDDSKEALKEEDVLVRAHRACTGQAPALLHRYSVVPRPDAEARALDEKGRRGATFVLAEREGHTTLTQFEATAFKKACMAVVQEVDDTLAEKTYVAVKERWADDAALKADMRSKKLGRGKGEGDTEGGGDGSDGKRKSKVEMKKAAAQRRNELLFGLQATVCNGNMRVCSAEGESSGAASSDASISSAGSKKRKTKTQSVEELLRKSGAGGQGCVYAHKGWWTYEICYGETITQYHVEHPETTDTSSLGVFDGVATAAAVLPKVPFLNSQDRLPGLTMRVQYFALKYNGGTYCEGVRNAEGVKKRVARTSTVQYACSPDGLEHVLVREPSTCTYVITVYLPAMCAHPQFSLKDNTL